MTDQPRPDGFDRDRLGLPRPGEHPEDCTCARDVNVEAAELLVHAVRDELDAELVLLIAPVTGAAACIATPWDPMRTAGVLRAIADDLTRQHAALS